MFGRRRREEGTLAARCEGVRMQHPVVIVGAGPSGLACARTLLRREIPCRILEAGSRMGGRIVTDEVEGFRLDVGFQILLTSYPELPKFVNLDRLHLGSFRSGALIRRQGGFALFPDPLREPWNLLRTLLSPVGSFFDKLRIARLGLHLWMKKLHPQSGVPSQTSLQFLRDQGFSEKLLRQFFGPFFEGIFLDEKLETDSRLLCYLFERFSKGRASLPAGGMGRFSEELGREVKHLVRFSSQVVGLEPGCVTLASGEKVASHTIVLATDGAAAYKLLGNAPRAFHATHCAYFSAPSSPLPTAHLALHPDRSSCIHNLCVPSDVAHGYAPAGQSLVSVTTVGGRSVGVEELFSALRGWFGPQVNGWRHLRSYSLPEALPAFPAGSSCRAAKLQDGLWQCGDQAGYPSLNSALETGRLVGEALRL